MHLLLMCLAAYAVGLPIRMLNDEMKTKVEMLPSEFGVAAAINATVKAKQDQCRECNPCGCCIGRRKPTCEESLCYVCSNLQCC